MTTCERCQHRSAVVTAYWGPGLCRECCAIVARLLDDHDKWPPVDVPATPAEVGDA